MLSHFCIDLSFGSSRYFMVSGLKGSGVKELHQYLMDQVWFLLLVWLWFSEITDANFWCFKFQQTLSEWYRRHMFFFFFGGGDVLFLSKLTCRLKNFSSMMIIQLLVIIWFLINSFTLEWSNLLHAYPGNKELYNSIYKLYNLFTGLRIF